MSPIVRGTLTGGLAFVVATILLGVIAAGAGGEAVVGEEATSTGSTVLVYVLIFLAGATGGAIGAWQARTHGGGPRDAVGGGFAGPVVVGVVLASASLSAGPVGALLSFVAIALGAFAGARAAARPRDELA